MHRVSKVFCCLTGKARKPPDTRWCERALAYSVKQVHYNIFTIIKSYFGVCFDGFSVLVDRASDQCHVDVVPVSEVFDKDLVSAAVRRITWNLRPEQQQYWTIDLTVSLSPRGVLIIANILLTQTLSALNIVRKIIQTDQVVHFV